MGYANQEGPYWSDVVLSADKNGDAIDARGCSCGSIALVWVDASATDAVVKLQESHDGIKWFDVASMTKTVGAATGSALWKLTRDILLSPLYRLVITKNSETTGTVTIRNFLKGDR